MNIETDLKNNYLAQLMRTLDRAGQMGFTLEVHRHKLVVSRRRSHSTYLCWLTFDVTDDNINTLFRLEEEIRIIELEKEKDKEEVLD